MNLTSFPSPPGGRCAVRNARARSTELRRHAFHDFAAAAIGFARNAFSCSAIIRYRPSSAFS